MSVGTRSDFQIYQPQFDGGYVEKQEQNLELIQGGSRGAIVMSSEYLKGDYRKESFFEKISGLVQRRVDTDVGDVTPLAITQGEDVTVKLKRRIGPVAQTLDAWRQIAADPEMLSFVFGQQAADDILAEKLNIAISASVAALLGRSGLIYDGTAGTMSHTALTRGLFKMGDQASRVIAWVMHSKVVGDLFVQAITDKVMEVAGVVINNGAVGSLNRPIIITDSPALIKSGTTPTYYTLGLVAGAIRLNDSEVPTVLSDTQLLKGNILGIVQGEYAYNLGLKGFAYDNANGGANPSDAAVATTSNWDTVMASDKSLCGVLIKSQ